MQKQFSSQSRFIKNLLSLSNNNEANRTKLTLKKVVELKTKGQMQLWQKAK